MKKIITKNLTNFISQKKVKEKIEQKLFLTRISSLVFQKRKENKLNQETLAKEIKSSQRIISEIENGQYNMSCNFLFKLFKKLNIELVSNNRDLITGEDVFYDININSVMMSSNSTEDIKDSNNSLGYCVNTTTTHSSQKNSYK